MTNSGPSPSRAGTRTASRPAQFKKVSRRRLLTDRLARQAVTVGGFTIIASILAILVVILAEVWPLFRAPRAEPRTKVASRIPVLPLLGGVDEHREVAFFLDPSGTIHLFSLAGHFSEEMQPLPGLSNRKIISAVRSTNGGFAVALDDGSVVPFEVQFDVEFHSGSRRILPRVVPGEPFLLVREDPRPLQRFALTESEEFWIVAGQQGPREVRIYSRVESSSLMGDSAPTVSSSLLQVPSRAPVSALTLDQEAVHLYLGTEDGQLFRYDLEDPETPRLAERLDVSSRPGATITVMGLLLGNQTLVIGDEAGGVTSWQLIRSAGGSDSHLTRMGEFRSHDHPVIALDPSRRNKGFVTGDSSGRVQVHYSTTRRSLLTIEETAQPLALALFAPKADGILLLNRQGQVSNWDIDNPHPEITLQTLFSPVWYEGYREPDLVWQSTGGSDDFEPKLSLTPLIYGTLKGTFYALLFAVPLALLAALYTSQFMHPSLKGIVKPTVEIMAALPSVVLGFVAGLWLAPMIERFVPALFLMWFLIPAMVLTSAFLWKWLPDSITQKASLGTEVILIMPVVLAGGYLSILLGGWIEQTLLAGDFRSWVLQALGLTYDQRNAMVVGIAMGFAVIPIIFTIAEDSLSQVPQHLKAGSLALGATRWQTALKIVLPTASPGIFSAIMIGLGRAVGETMVVLMATGNTPIMESSIFNGFRALSANIAVELPEAPHGGTLYRVLFLAALLLFLMTFLVNTLAEAVRIHLRRKFRYL